MIDTVGCFHAIKSEVKLGTMQPCVGSHEQRLIQVNI